MEYHKPVLLNESVQGLAIKPDGVYVDLTFGGGGHSREIIKYLNAKGRLYGFDQDESVFDGLLVSDMFQFCFCNFRYFHKYLEYYEVDKVDGILADLGVSSHQFDTESRGFSFRADEKLDMRMNKYSEQTAGDVLNSYPEMDLVKIFSEFGQVRNAKTLAREIVRRRKDSSFEMIHDFVGFLDHFRMGSRSKYLATVFQALRIEVNDEIGALHEMLKNAIDCLAPGGRLVMISYHSVEDRAVKKWFKYGNRDGLLVKDDYGNVLKPLKMTHKKVIVPDESEVKVNNRARSAKLRIAEKI
jgi:16S rRNA (cytosine1402-N4)-methyltransferase